MARVRYDRVSKSYGEVVAVDDFTLDVADGEFLVLVGPSGCGKSTALRLLAGLEPASSGDIYIGDRCVNDVRAKDRDIAMVFQSYALYPHMSVFDNMAFGLRLRGVPGPEVRARVEEASAVLGLDELLRRKPGQLSGGQRQRVALGRAIVRRPAVFLLDEPLSNLDAKLRVQTRAELRKLHERLGATFIYVTHDQVEAMTMASRIAVMDRGLLMQAGTAEELYDRPANRFVAGFIGSPAMNFMEARVERGEEGRLGLDAGPFRFSIPADRAPTLEPYSGRRIVLGVRPEHIHSREYVPAGVEATPLEAAVEVVEMLGSEKYLHLTADGIALLARVDSRTTARAGERAALIVDTSRLHAFDAETDAAISLAPARP